MVTLDRPHTGPNPNVTQPSISQISLSCKSGCLGLAVRGPLGVVMPQVTNLTVSNGLVRPALFAHQTDDPGGTKSASENQRTGLFSFRLGPAPPSARYRAGVGGLGFSPNHITKARRPTR